MTLKRLPQLISIGDKYEPAMKIEEQAEADAYFELLVEHCQRKYPAFDDKAFVPNTRETAELIERTNLGYFAGYYDHETRARVEKLFRCAHPIFGAIAVNGPPSAETALAMGYMAGARNRGPRTR
jgi:hypothetical protein